ncbi:MAG TPA: AIR synthase related protein, partial [Candidatus Dormibacteraeota bacterium]
MIARLTGDAAGVMSGGVLVGPGDDAAVWQPPPHRAVAVTQDALVEEVDFRREWITPYQLGRRCLAVALSDLA